MANIRINPFNGDLAQSKQVMLLIDGIPISKGMRLVVDNETILHRVEFIDCGDNKNKVDVVDNIVYFKEDLESFSAIIDLKISENSSSDVYSIFVNIETPDGNGGYKAVSITPLMYSVNQYFPDFRGSVVLEPSYVGVNNVCKITVDAYPSERVVFSINDKRLMMHVKADGVGTLHFRVSDIIDENSLNGIQRFPVYAYISEDNYVEKKFTGAHLSVLPQDLATFAEDPRCDYITPTNPWVMPEECLGGGGGTNEPVSPTLPVSCLRTLCSTGSYSPPVCKIHSFSSSMGRKGEIFTTFNAVKNSDKNSTSNTFNVTSANLNAKNSSLLGVEIVANTNVNVSSKVEGANLLVYVSEEVYNKVVNYQDVGHEPSLPGLYMTFIDARIGYQCVEIVSNYVDEYTGDYIFVGDGGDAPVSLTGWLFCVPMKVIDFIDSSVSMGENFNTLTSYVYDSDNLLYYPIVSTSVSSNIYNNSSYGYVYVVAEALVDGVPQLYYHSISSDHDGGTGGWIKLTSEGMNKNPKIKVDRYNGLHIVWESDRSGQNQIYYSYVGPNRNVQGMMILASTIDKYAEFLQLDKESSIYTSQNIFIDATNDSEYVSIPEYHTSDLLSGTWTEYENGGDVTISSGSSFLGDIQISVNAVSQGAMAVTQLPILIADQNPSLNPSVEEFCKQYNFQIDFSSVLSVTQTSSLLSSWEGNVLDSKNIDNYFETWLSGFASLVGEFGNPLFEKNNNKYVVGRVDNIYDRFIPFVGSYDLSDISNGVKTKLLKNDSNVKDFVFGVMLEKSYFKATNYQTLEQFVGEGNNEEDYVSVEEHTIFTGRAKLVVLIKSESSLNDKENYCILRDFPDSFDILTPHNFSILCNYREISSGEVAFILNKQDGIYDNRYAGIITLLIDGSVKFSQAFVSHLDPSYNYFDIGFGVPEGGSYSADKMVPFKMTIYDDVAVNMFFYDIDISSPYYAFNTEIITVPQELVNMSYLAYSVCDSYDINTLGVYENSEILQIPLTFEGINKNPSIDVGGCGDAHITWQGNKTKYWNIYAYDSNNKFRPLRYLNTITNSSSNSIMPSISVNSNGTRMIVWQDNREGKFKIFAARSLYGYSCDDVLCRNKMFEPYSSYVEQCVSTFGFEVPISDYYKFDLYFYNDSGLSDLYKIISSEECLLNTRGEWYIDGTALGSLVSYNEDNVLLGIYLQYGQTVSVSYVPHKNDGIFDRVLYAKLSYMRLG